MQRFDECDAPQKVRLLVADDHPVVRCGIAEMLRNSKIEVIAEAATGNEAIELAMTLKPDVVLLDVRMPETNGWEALERILDCSPETKVVMLTAHDNPAFIGQATALGAAGYLLKGMLKDELVSIIQRAHFGLPSADASLMPRARSRLSSYSKSYTKGDIPEWHQISYRRLSAKA